MTSVCWVICSSSTYLGLQLRTERHWARTCSEESRQVLGQLVPWQDASQQLTIIRLHTPLLGRHGREVGRERQPSSHPWVSAQRGCSDFSSLLVGLQGGGLFPQPLPFNLSSEWGWRTTHRMHGRLQQVNLWHVPTWHMFRWKGGTRCNRWLTTLPRARPTSTETDLALRVYPWQVPWPEDLLLFHKRPRCGYWPWRGKVNSHCWPEKQEYALRKGDDWQMTPFPRSCPK